MVAPAAALLNHPIGCFGGTAGENRADLLEPTAVTKQHLNNSRVTSSGP
jgi:hypothetical protein